MRWEAAIPHGQLTSLYRGGSPCKRHQRLAPAVIPADTAVPVRMAERTSSSDGHGIMC